MTVQTRPNNAIDSGTKLPPPDRRYALHMVRVIADVRRQSMALGFRDI
jgi:hypothetical protein